MAIDTAAKRRSAAGLPFLPLGPGVTPDAAKPLAWRQEAGWGYSGLPAGLLIPNPSSDGDFWTVPYYYQRRVWRRTSDMGAAIENGEVLYLGVGENKTFGFDFSREGAVRDGGVLSNPEIEIEIHPDQQGTPDPPAAGTPEVIPTGRRFTDSDGKFIRAGKGVRVRLVPDEPGRFLVSCSVTVTDEDGADDVLKGGGVLVVE